MEKFRAFLNTEAVRLVKGKIKERKRKTVSEQCARDQVKGKCRTRVVDPKKSRREGHIMEKKKKKTVRYYRLVYPL